MESEPNRAAAIRELLRRPEIRRRRVSPDAFRVYDASLTHRSYAKERNGFHGEVTDNERLEFLGDRVLNLVIADFLFSEFDEPEGSLSLRMEWTKNRNLASVISSAAPQFPGLIRLGKNQALTPRILAGAFEAFIGALYLDAGLDTVKRMVITLFSENIQKFSTNTNYKKNLQEHLQKQNLPLPVYELEHREGQPHSPRFSYVVLSGGRTLGKGTGKTKSEATQNAARNALEGISF
jgi:ribonuclease-3